jgi:23S rRNA (guanine1835-N2)-methyltransferase
MNALEFNGKEIQLDRIPQSHSSSLRAWDAADEYALSHCLEEGLLNSKSIMLVNDTFGALALALHPLPVTSWSDSHLARLALEHNLDVNELEPSAITFLSGHLMPTTATAQSTLDLVILKVPKSMDWWAEELRRLAPLLTPSTKVITAGMLKHTPKRTWELLEEIIGPTQTSLAKKKARLGFTIPRENLSHTPHPNADIPSYNLESLGIEILNFPNVFSAKHLDNGTRLLIKALPSRKGELKVADLGCGNGVLCLEIAHLCPESMITGVDESYQAVACTNENAKRTSLSQRIVAHAADGLNSEENDSFDLVLCNPPFHQNQTIGDQTAWSMFHQARRKLKMGGEFWVVGNRHLNYHIKLKRLFGNCEMMLSDKKFTVLKATRLANAEENLSADNF